MRFRDTRKIHFLYLVLDTLIICVAFYLPCKFNPTRVPQNLLEFRPYLSIFVIWGLTLLFLLNNAHLYSTDRSLSIPREWWLIIRCVLFTSILAALFIFVLKIDIFSRFVFLEVSILLILSLSAWRTLKRIWIRHLIQKGYSNFNVLIIGAGKAGLALSKEIQNNTYLGLNIVGFLDDRHIDKINGFRILGKINDLGDVVTKHFVDEVYITIPSERKITSEIIQQAIKLGKTIRIVAEQFDFPYQQVELNYIGFIPLVTYFEKSLHGTEQFIKRLLDIVGSGALLILFLPPILVIAILIKIFNPGPVFYISQRCGKKRRVFNFYKFRSMINNADIYKDTLRHKSEVDGPIFKIKKDPRITQIGKFLRKYSLDELPQLFNVLKGDMSLVGPRPFPVEETQKIENKYTQRLNIKPGITGLAQIKGRSDLTFHRWAKWDLWYINNWSFGLDLLILLWTIPAVLKRRGAY